MSTPEDVQSHAEPASRLQVEVAQTPRGKAPLTDLATITTILYESIAGIASAVAKQRRHLGNAKSSVGVRQQDATTWEFLIDGQVHAHCSAAEAWQKLKSYGVTGLKSPGPSSRGDLIVFQDELAIDNGPARPPKGPHHGPYGTILWQGDSRYIPVHHLLAGRFEAVQCLAAAHPRLQAASEALREAASAIRRDVLVVLPDGSFDTQTQSGAPFLHNANRLWDCCTVELVGTAERPAPNHELLTGVTTLIVAEAANMMPDYAKHVAVAYRRARGTLRWPDKRRLHRDKVADLFADVSGSLRDADRMLHTALYCLEGTG